MSDIEDILTLEFIKAVENRKKKIARNRNKDYLTMTDLRNSNTDLSNNSVFLISGLNLRLWVTDEL